MEPPCLWCLIRSGHCSWKVSVLKQNKSHLLLCSRGVARLDLKSYVSVFFLPHHNIKLFLFKCLKRIRPVLYVKVRDRKDSICFSGHKITQCRCITEQFHYICHQWNLFMKLDFIMQMKNCFIYCYQHSTATHLTVSILTECVTLSLLHSSSTPVQQDSIFFLTRAPALTLWKCEHKRLNWQIFLNGIKFIDILLFTCVTLVLLVVVAQQ